MTHDNSLKEMKKTFLTSVALVVSLSGCMANIVDDSRVSETISVYKVSCKKPYDMVRDCSNVMGPTRGAALNGESFEFGGTEAGNVVLITLKSEDIAGEGMEALVKFGFTDDMGTRLSELLKDIDEAFLQKHIHISKMVPIIAPDWFVHVGSVGNVYGYYLELSGDGYAVLETFATEESEYSELLK